jgi:hypothetical protein
MNLKLIWLLLLFSPLLALSQADYARRCTDVDKSGSLQLKQICQKQAKSLKLITFNQRKATSTQKRDKPVIVSSPTPSSSSLATIKKPAASVTNTRRTAPKESALKGSYLTYKPYVPGAYTATNSQEKDDES